MEKAAGSTQVKAASKTSKKTGTKKTTNQAKNNEDSATEVSATEAIEAEVAETMDDETEVAETVDAEIEDTRTKDTEAKDTEIVVVETKGTEAEVDKKLPKKSKARLTLEKFTKLKKEYKEKNLPLSQRTILRILGGSFSTAAKLERQLELLEKGTIDLEIIISEATMQAVRDDINRHLESYRDSLNEQVELVEQVKGDIESLTSAFNSLTKAALRELGN
jgi:hypothetical protein